MIDRQTSTSPWSQTMSRIHSTTPDNESMISNNQPETSLNYTTTKLMPLQDEPNSHPPRKRNNSLIPIELMINNSGEGGRECAALATVFGVPEYIDSKIFWERQQYQHEGLLPKKQINQLLRPTTPSSSNQLQDNSNNKYGYISVKNISVVSRPIGSSSTGVGDEDMLQNHEIQSKFIISSYVDSVLDPVGSNEVLKPSFPGSTSSSAPIPTPTKSFSLPKIPAVSKFNDILLEDENGCELMFPANPSSVLMHSSTPMARTESLSSAHSSFNVVSHQKQSQDIIMTQDQDEETFKTTSKVVVIIGPPEIFDLLLSDEDERFIIWGPDPIVLSSSMATTTSITPERPSSYSNLYNSQHSRPELKGFSSNATSTLARSHSIQNVKPGSTGQRPSFASVRMSAQHWSESLKLGRPGTIKHSMSANDRPPNGSLLLKKAFGLKRYNSQKKPIAPSNVNELEHKDIPKVIEAATIHKLVEKLTNTLDYTFMTDFFLTYRDFLNSEDLCQLLVSRFYWALQTDEESRRIVRIRTFVVLRHWLNNYFVHDFIGNRALRTILTQFLNKLPRHPLVKDSPRDQRIVKTLKRVVRRLKKLYYHRSSGSARVKVIAPPPPTAAQEQMGEIVRAKLSQNAIRRKAALGVDMSSHHNGNMAVQDARYAPVVVVGSLNMKGSFIDSGVESASNHHFVNRSSSFPPLNSNGHENGSVLVSGLEDNQTIQSSINHHSDKSGHEPTDIKDMVPASDAIEASSVTSVVSDDSLDSEISAGETAPNQSDESDDDDQSHIQHDYFVEYDDHDRHWMQEQQETLEYFKSMDDGNKQPMFNHSGLSQTSSGSSNQLNTTGLPLITSSLTTSPTAASPINYARPNIPPEFFQVETKADLTNDYSSPSISAKLTHNTPVAEPSNDVNDSIDTTKTIRRVPSERWCKTDDECHDNNKHPFDLDSNSKALPDELLKELSGNESQHPLGRSPSGLSRKLSKKSIERRKSERSFHDSASAWSSVPSSAAASPYLTGANSVHDIPEVPELPPLTPDMIDNHPLAKKDTPKPLKNKRNSLRKKNSNVEQTPTEPIDKFASIPYESTQVTNIDEMQSNFNEPVALKRRLSRGLSKMFRHNSRNGEGTPAKGYNQARTDEVITTRQNKENLAPSTEHQQDNEKSPNQQSSQLVSLIAQRLRLSSVDESDTIDDCKCDCVKCSGNKDATTTCRRLSVMCIADDERRRSFELRRKRGASIDMDQQLASNYMGFPSTDSKTTKDVKSGPVYLGHLQARSMIGTNDCRDENIPDKATESDGSDESDEDSTASFVPSERSIQTEAQASSSRTRMSFMSDSTHLQHVPRSKLIELGIPPLSSTAQETYEALSLEPTMTRSINAQNGLSIPQHIPDASIPKQNSRCFIMSYRTSKLASQLCFIERDVLVKVGWEELIHCKWTKMDASGNINHNKYTDIHTFDGDDNEGKINYTRQTEQRRIEEQGIEQVIQRFNTVCQWVSSEIVRTRNINERVKLIEKFVRLAKKCKMYSNYATLVQILLGLQSPAVARLEKTWCKVSTKCQKQLNKLTEFTSPMKNWKNIRDSMTEVAEEYGNSPAEVQVEMPGTTANRQKFKKTTRIKIPFGGCIPFLGIYLSDLVFNSEKPRYLQPNLESQKIYSVNNTRNLPTCLDQPLVNFRKHRVIATVIKRVLTFQGLAVRYSFDEDGFLLEKCRNLEVLDAAKIRELSVSLE